MHAFDEQVGRKKKVLPGAARTKNRAIVTDSEDHPASRTRFQFAADTLD